MLLHPIPASLYHTLPEDKIEILKSVGGIPVNDVYVSQFGDRSAIRLFFGGYGGGKSNFVVQDLINKCLNDQYFKCYYGRKVLETVRGSCFETIVETIEDMGIRREFKYSTATNSAMHVTCRRNGNKFVPFGADKVEKLKSIKDPTHIWCEEFDQFEDAKDGKQGDFQLLFPRLRTEKGITEFIGTFNTAPVFPTHWILKYFFPDLYDGKKSEFDFMKGVKVSKCFSNFTDNQFINQEEYDARLRLSSGGNTTLYEAIARGAWGVVDNENPWLYNFDYQKHVKDVKFLPSYPVYCAFDFNVAPFACTLWQFAPDLGTKNAFIHCIGEIVGNNDIKQTCDMIRSRYPGSVLFINGDRSGQNADLGRNQTLYQMIASELGINPMRQLILHSANLEHADSWTLCNTMFWNYPNLFIHPSCRELIKDCQRARNDDKGKPYQIKKDRQEYKMDAFDSMRYFMQDYFLDFARKTYLRAISRR